jgi:hypothetical protein
MPALQPWTAFTNDTATQAFAGSAVYTARFELKKEAPDYLLRLGAVHESAKVQINGKDAGILWHLPFEMRIGKYLRKGENTITVEIANLMANRIRDMDRKHIEWRKYNEINFVNINYKNFDAANWKVQPSGLAGPVTVIALMKD